jgi:hypothetical protein
VTIACPHCGAANNAADAFCAACGKALPVASTGPRVVSADQTPLTAAGTQLVGDELVKQTRSAANTLLVVACLQLIVGGLLIFAMAASAHVPMTHPSVLFGLFTVAGISAVFFGLYAWARVAPLPATIVGLVVYCTLIVINVLSAVSAIGSGGRGIGIGWLDIVIVIFLAKGIGAGLKYRRLRAASLPT